MVLATDTQLTGSSMKEFGTKITTIGDHSLLACSGLSEYIESFKRQVKDAIEESERDPQVDLMKVLDQVRLQYAKQVDEERKFIPLDYMEEIGLRPSHFYPDAIFLTMALSKEASSKRIVSMNNPRPYVEVLHPMQRATAGTGGDIAQIFLRTIEHAMGVAGFAFDQLPVRLVTQFCYIMLGRVAFIDPSSSGVSIYELIQDHERVSAKQMLDTDIFPKHHANRDVSHFAEFLETARNEIPRDALKNFLGFYNIDPLALLNGSR